MNIATRIRRRAGVATGQAELASALSGLKIILHGGALRLSCLANDFGFHAQATARKLLKLAGKAITVLDTVLKVW